MAPQVTIPAAGWKPRPYQVPLWRYLTEPKRTEGGKRAAAVWHRRGGKDTVAINALAFAAMERPGIYWHVLPTYAQGRKIIWEGRTKEGKPFLDAFPKELVVRRRDDEMMLWLTNGSIYQVVAADQFDTLVGTNPVGIVLSEYSLQHPRFWDFVRPVLAENNGWALFIYTPRGRNHGWDLLEAARKNEATWFSQVLTVEDTKAITLAAVEAERAAGMPEELIQQEFYCSFDAGLVGSYYGQQIKMLREQGRIALYPYDPKYPVMTGWDIGVGDETAIWWAQDVGPFCRLLEYYEAAGAGVEHYAKHIFERPYAYHRHFWPHDGGKTEWGSGQTLIETAHSLGLRVHVLPRMAVEDGIQSVRNLLAIAQINEPDCKVGLRAITEYTKEWDDKKKRFLESPDHNWASNGADALRTLAMGRRSPERRTDAGQRLRRRPAIV